MLRPGRERTAKEREERERRFERRGGDGGGTASVFECANCGMRSRFVILAYLFAAAGWVAAAGTLARASLRRCALRLGKQTRDCGGTKCGAWGEPEPPARVFAGVAPGGEDFSRDRPREIFVRELRG